MAELFCYSSTIYHASFARRSWFTEIFGMNVKEACSALTPHPVRKLCKNCHMAKERHLLSEEDVENVKRNLKIFSEQPVPTPHAQYAWTPPECPVDRLDEYFKKFPENEVPRHQSEGQQKRLSRFLFQIPLPDVSVENSRFVDPDCKDEQEKFVRELQDSTLRLGCVKEWCEGMPVQCPRCLLILESGELVVMTSSSGGPAYHPPCFVCFECDELLSDLVLCSDVNGVVFCVRHYCDNNRKRCHVCDELIFSSRYALAGDKFYHRNHLLCYGCDHLLESHKGYEKEKELYCGRCYEDKFCKDCAKCNKRITLDSRHVTYREENWHYDCFTCHECDVVLSDCPFERVDEKFYCTHCYNDAFAPKCKGCNAVFDPRAKVVKYESEMYHVPCFKCVDCGDSIGTGSFVPHEGRVYCKGCHLRHFGVRCFRCKYSITDERGIMYNKEPYHEDCFVCHRCSTNIASRPFKTVDDHWYCMNCYGDTFCKKCHSCEQPILLGADQDILYSFDDYRWHASCFQCSACEQSLADTPFTMRDKVLVCKSCLLQDGKKTSEQEETS